MKETITPIANQTQQLRSCLSAEITSGRSVIQRIIIQIWGYLLLKKADHLAVSPRCVPSGYLGATRQAVKSKSPRWYLVNVVLCLVFVGPDLAAPFIGSQTAWAAPAYLAYQTSLATHLIPDIPYASVDTGTPACPDPPITVTPCEKGGNRTRGLETVCTDPTPEKLPCLEYVKTCALNQQSTPTNRCNPNPNASSSSSSGTSNSTSSSPGTSSSSGTGWCYVHGGGEQPCPSGGTAPPPSSGCPIGVPQSICEISNGIDSFWGDIKTFFEILHVLFTNNPVGWLACIVTAGTVACPTLSNIAPWAFDCPVDMAAFESDASNSPVISELSTTTSTVGGIAVSSVVSTAAVGGGAGGAVGGSSSSQQPEKDRLTIYQTALQSGKANSQTDWLSGDGSVSDTSASSLTSEPGHLIYTYAADTTEREKVKTLSSLSLGLGILMIGPLFALVGFQILLASVRISSEKALANAMEGLGRVLLAGAIVGLSYYVVQMLFTFLNTANQAVVELHKTIGYPQTMIDGKAAVSYSVAGDSPQSFRGIVIPMDLWGCVMDDFLGLMASRVANMIGSTFPVIGGIFGMTGRITEIGDLIKDLGEFGLLIMSVTIWGQAVARIVLINYYIIMAPVAFACWGLPGYQGNQVMGAWFKGFLQLLFMQTLQLFILTTLPALLPDFGLMHFPQGGSMINPPIQALLVQLPPIITAASAVGAPKMMMGMGPMRTVAQAGALAGRAVAATGMAVSTMIKKK